VKDYNSKDIRKYTDVLSKRVEKHFTDGEKGLSDESNGSSKVLLEVWKACEEELCNSQKRGHHRYLNGIVIVGSRWNSQRQM